MDEMEPNETSADAGWPAFANWNASDWGKLAALLAVMCLALVGLGRVPWCSCGGYVPWSWVVMSKHNSQHLIDAYSFTHVLHGFLFFGFLWPLRKWLSAKHRILVACLIEACWEILENSPIIIDRYREATISLDYYGDSIFNSVADVVCCLLGYYLTSRMRWYWAVGVFLLVELVLLMTIRDSLILNIIMLTYPLESILEWQSGTN